MMAEIDLPEVLCQSAWILTATAGREFHPKTHRGREDATKMNEQEMIDPNSRGLLACSTFPAMRITRAWEGQSDELGLRDHVSQR
jgi:hypothetical protein